jgi:hypothetical protein
MTELNSASRINNLDQNTLLKELAEMNIDNILTPTVRNTLNTKLLRAYNKRIESSLLPTLPPTPPTALISTSPTALVPMPSTALIHMPPTAIITAPASTSSPENSQSSTVLSQRSISHGSYTLYGQFLLGFSFSQSKNFNIIIYHYFLINF